jgi:cytochrome P450
MPEAKAFNTYRDVSQMTTQAKSQHKHTGRSDIDLFPPFFQMSEAFIEDVKKENPDEIDLDGRKVGSKPTLFRYMIHKGNLPESEKSTTRLANEAQNLLGAGSLTTARTAVTVFYYLLENPSWRKRLSDEVGPLMAEWPHNPPTWAQLEKLPFLQAMIQEALR